MPPPLPRSSTSSPGESVASVVGLPHPKDAAPAAWGSPPSSSAEYPPPVQSTPSASESRPRSPAEPQHDDDPAPSKADRAAPAYLSLTRSRNNSSPMTLGAPSDQLYLIRVWIKMGWFVKGKRALFTEVPRRGILRSSVVRGT